MTARDYFGLIVRTLGLLVLLLGLYYELGALSVFFMPRGTHKTPLGASVFFGVALGALGAFLLRRAPFVVRFSYPGAPDASGSALEPVSRHSDSSV